MSSLSLVTQTTPLTAAEFIFNSIQQRRASKSNSELSEKLNDTEMIPPTEQVTGELIETRPSLKRERADTSGSNRSNGFLSMDLAASSIRSEDLQLDGGLSGIGSERFVKSGDLFKELITPSNSAGTAPVRCDKLCPLVELASKLERITTGDEVVPLNKDIRISSTEWIKDFQAETESGVGAMSPRLFETPHPVTTTSMPPVTTSMPPLTTSMPPLTTSMPSDVSKPSSEEFCVPLQQSTSRETSKNEKKLSLLTSTSTKKRRRKKKKRLVDESRVFEPTDNDVLFGRGGFTNTHPGNVKFREKALELRPWYESVSKEEKYGISDLLVEYVKATGNHFLEKGSDGLWHEVIDNGARKKASQALRERVKGKRGSANKDNGIVGESPIYNKSAPSNSVENLVGDVHHSGVLGV